MSSGEPLRRRDREEEGRLRREKKLEKREKVQHDIKTQKQTAGTSMLTTPLKVMGLFALIPLVLLVPWALNLSGTWMKDRTHWLYYLWGLYAVVLLSIFFVLKKQTITWNSFATQNLTYMIFTLGAYTMADIPRFLPFELRQVALYLWCSFTMIFNVAFFLFDDTNYQEEERKEKRKEEKRKKKEEERKKREEDEKKKQEEGITPMNPMLKKLIDVVLYAVYLLIIAGVINYGYNWYLNFQERIEYEHGAGSAYRGYSDE